MNNKRITATILVAAATLGLSACIPEAIQPEPFTIGLLPDTQGGTDSEGQAHVALHPMKQVLDHQLTAGTDMVIALGDLTDHGSTVEWDEWTTLAETYRAQGIEFLPVMGNHELNYAYTTEWIANMRNFIAEDAQHMPGYEWINYYVVRSNVLVIGLAYYNLPIAFQWVKEVIEEHSDKVDHIVVASHDGLIGAKYGQTREQIVEGTKGDDWVFSVQKDIRAFFSEHDVIYVQGHEHQYQRSLISATTSQTTWPSGSTPSGGNYRMGAYTQIMAGNASYKGYEFRYGERELVQMIVSQKNATMSNGSDQFDVNSSLLTFNGERVSYESYYAGHTAINNAAEQDFTADWKLMDQFDRSVNRCETVVYPNSIPEGTRSVMVFQTEYMSDHCLADDGSSARLVGGINDTFNRTDTRSRDMSYTPGFSRAESLMDLTRLAYQWLYQYHEAWTPNLNNLYRAVPDETENAVLIPETTIDLKEHVTLSWLSADGTASDILIISGTQNQTGQYQGDFGEPKYIEADSGLATSQPDGSVKAPVTLPATAIKSWDISKAVSDLYAVELTASNPVNAGNVVLAQKVDGHWVPVTTVECLLDSDWMPMYLSFTPDRPTGCEDQPLTGFNHANNTWWTLLTSDAELALIRRS